MITENLLAKIVDISREAGAAILDIYGNADFGVEIKSDQSPLTLADKKSNDIICKGLELLEPRFPIVSEENKEIAYNIRKAYEYFWLVDPLDGTKEFIKRNGEFTVNIALIHKQQPVLSAVYAPWIDEMYYAKKGLGAFFEKEGQKIKLQGYNFSMNDSGLKVVCSRSHLSAETTAFIDRLNAPVQVATGSSLKFLIIAKGNAHLYPRLGPTMEWDTAAAHLVLEEAGGKVIDETTGAPLLYNKENLLNPYFIAYGSVIENQEI